MSMLLEALRKSDQQRRMGQTPDIHSPADAQPSSAAGRGAPWVPMAMMALAAVAIGYFTWQQYLPPADLDKGDIARDAVSPAPSTAQRSGPATPDSGTARSQTAAPSPVESFRATEEDGSSPAADDAKRQALAKSFEQFDAPPANDADGAPRADSGPPEVAEPSIAARSTTVPARPAQTGEVKAPEERGVVSYWELPQNVRDSMPELKITVLVFAERPQDRFLLMGGRRLVENDEIDGVRLEAIRRDGAVFRYRDYRFTVDG